MYVRKRVTYSVVALILFVGLPAIVSVTLYKSSAAKPSQFSLNPANEGEYYDYTQTLDLVSVVTVDGFAKTYGVPLDSAYQNPVSSKASVDKSGSSTKVSTPSSITVVPAQLPSDTNGVVIQRMPNGAVKATLPDRFLPTVKATISKDGAVVVSCNEPTDNLTK